MGISPKGITLSNLDRVTYIIYLFNKFIVKVLIEFIQFNKIASWGVNKSVAVLVIEKNGDFIKFYFETLQVNFLVNLCSRKQYNIY